MVKSAFILLLFNAIGEFVSICIKNALPGSVIGMVLLFLALTFRWVRPEWVRPGVAFLTRNMALFFVPAAVGVMAYGELLAGNLAAILLGIAGSTVVTMAVVGLLQQRLEARRSGAEVESKSEPS